MAWPVLLAGCVAATAVGFRAGWPATAFYATYAGLIAALLSLERWLPHEADWTRHDGELAADLSHTLVSNAAVQALVFAGVLALAHLRGHFGLGGPGLGGTGLSGTGLWPTGWPLAAQVALGLVASEFALYWGHRLAHEWPVLWHFHAVHHSVGRLWSVNSGRFHFVDAAKSVLPGVAILVALGAPDDILAWLSALGAFIGTMTHCNVAMRFGPLSLVFNTPELHRWHHSMDLREGNTNYGENLMIWDLVFGTWFHEPWRRPPAIIGVPDLMPSRFRDQLLVPFARARATLRRDAPAIATPPPPTAPAPSASPSRS